MPIFGFAKQKAAGKIGEADFFKYYAYLGVKKEDGLKWDFSLDGDGIELKLDSWKMCETPNLFIELVSNVDKQTKGGVYRAFEDKVKYFVYYYIQDKTFLWYDVGGLYQFVKKNEPNLVLKTIRNKKYESLGALVKRRDVEKFIIRNDVFA